MIVSLALHAHQPPGNFDRVFQEAVDRCYRPVLDLIEARPTLQLSMHWSGSLLEWLEAHEPTLIDQIRRLAASGQVELMCAGMYEPVLALLPRHDRAWQVELHRRTLARLFGVETNVGWLTERVWEPELAEDIASGGIGVLPLDEGHLVAAGIDEEEMASTWLTEGAGLPIRIVPASEWFRMSVPWEPVTQVLDHLSQQAASGRAFAVYADDIEKFGMWPETYHDVIEGRWLEAFLDGLVAGPEIEPVALGELARRAPLGGRTYIPDNTYREMLDWSLRPGARQRIDRAREEMTTGGLSSSLRYVRAGQFRLFLAKYPEANHLQKRMQGVSNRFARAASAQASTTAVGRLMFEHAREELGRAQANCAYWHGLFGGTYLPHLRQRLWHHLLRAELVLDELQRVALPSVGVSDLDADGAEEILIRTDDLVVVVDPDDGCVTEVAHRETGTNLADTLARRPETYHEATDASVSGSEDWDRGRRGWFVDSFSHAANTPDEFGLDGGSYRGEPAPEGLPAVTLSCIGQRGDASIQVSKLIEVDATTPRVVGTYEISTSENVAGYFSSTINLGVLFADPVSGRLTSGGSSMGILDGGTLSEVTGASVDVDGVPVEFTLLIDPPCTLRVRPIVTLSHAEGAFQETPQQIELTCTWPVQLDLDDAFRPVVDVRVHARPGTHAL